MDATGEPGSRPRRRGRWIVAILVFFVLLVAAAIAIELIVRSVVPARLAETIRDELRLSPDHPVEITLDGILTPGLLAGRLHDVTVTIPNVPLPEGIRADLTGSAESVPLNFNTGALEGATIAARIDGESVERAVQVLTGGVAQTAEIHGEYLTVSNSIPILGGSIPISVDIAVAPRGGNVQLTLLSIDAAGMVSVTPDQLRSVPGGLFDPLLDGVDVCIADRLPAGVTVTDIALSTTQTITIVADVHPEIGMDPTLQEFGTC